MTGSLQTKDGKYYAVLNTYDTKGKRKIKWISTGLSEKGNKKRAEKFLRKKIHEYEIKEEQIHTDMLFSDAVRNWLNKTKFKVDEITFQGYEILCNAHILPYFDDLELKLQDVDYHVLQKYIDVKAQNGNLKTGEALSARSLKLHKNVLFQTCTEARRMDLLTSNPCDLVTLPPSERYEPSFYTMEQINNLLDACKDEAMYYIIKTAIIYGLRRSEVLGLKWGSIDFSRKSIIINSTRVKVKKEVQKNKTKNESSRRSFPLLPEMEDMFLEMKGEEEKNRKSFNKEYIENDYVFKWPDGHLISPDYVSRKFSKLLVKYEMPHIRFHDLRHSCASLLLSMGYELKDVQEWLGHADIKMTANIYGHLDIRRKQVIAEAFSNNISG